MHAVVSIYNIAVLEVLTSNTFGVLFTPTLVTDEARGAVPPLIQLFTVRPNRQSRRGCKQHNRYNHATLKRSSRVT